MSEEIYKEIILDHYKNPRNFGKIEGATFSASDNNPLCGDHVEITAKINGGKVEQLKFIGRGCAISMAAASIITEMAQGLTLDELRGLDKEQLLEAMGNPDLGPVRIKCALLPLKTLKLALYNYLSSSGKDAQATQ